MPRFQEWTAAAGETIASRVPGPHVPAAPAAPRIRMLPTIASQAGSLLLGQPLLYVAFLALVGVLMAFDLGLLGGKSHVVSTREALRRTAFMVSFALVFTVGVYFLYDTHWLGMGRGVVQIDRSTRDVGGAEASTLYITGWLVEYSLSLDNLFVFLLIFRFFKVPQAYQHRALVWGIVGAIVLRGALILPGAELAKHFEWTTYVFGGLLILSAAKMLLTNESDELDLEKNLAVRAIRSLFRVARDYDRDRFFTRVDQQGANIPSEERKGRPGFLAVTPLFLVLMVVDLADVMFAVDSIPAIFGITLDPFIVFTSNIFAILGLRSLYFALAALLDQFRYLKMSMIIILFFVGTKMLLHEWLHEYITPGVSLSIIVGLLAAGIVPSLIYNRRIKREIVKPIEEDVAELAEITYRNAKKLVILVIGSTLVVIGVIAVIMPVIPGWPLAFIGLAILATEFIWARRLLKRLKREVHLLANRARQAIGMRPPPGQSDSARTAKK